jgi:hypothetical protein
MSLRMAVESRNAELSALAAMADGGKLCIYTGNIPATPESSTNGTLLAELRFGTPAFNAPSGGQMSATTISGEDSALAGGVAGWCRVVASDGVTTLFDGDVGTSGKFLNLNSTNIQSGATVNVSSLVVAIPQ